MNYYLKSLESGDLWLCTVALLSIVVFFADAVSGSEFVIINGRREVIDYNTIIKKLLSLRNNYV